jgi:uncharacterized protein
MDLTVVYWILVATMFIGAIGEFIPGVPGTSLILLAISIWAIVTKFAGINLLIIVVFAVLAFSWLIEFLAAFWGAKEFGASKWGQIGAIVGLVFGILGLLPALPFGGPILGILFGPFIGAFIGEFLYQHHLDLDSRLRVSFRASVGTVVGSLIGNLIDGMLAIIAVIVFLFSTLGFAVY